MKFQKIILYLAVLFTASCRIDPKINPPAPVNQIAEVIPEGWPLPVYRFTNNPLSEKKFILGRALFYEPMLSRDNTISCGSCHQDFAAFANGGEHKVSHGINDLEGNRNSPSIFNIAWHPTFMHDGGINHIEVMPLAPITNPVEMGEDINNVISKLEASPKYRSLFKDAFSSDTITSQRMFRSMAQFMCLIYSSNSKYDQYKRQENGVQFTESEQKGYTLFIDKCSGCHTEPLFSDFNYRNNGLAVHPNFNDSGRAKITMDPADLYKFKTPSLRNVAFTGPYMHDGRYGSLEECLDHYTDHVVNKTNLDPRLTNGLQLSVTEKKDIISFLHTLSDYTLVNDKRFSNPN